jgi:hypothetical protein
MQQKKNKRRLKRIFFRDLKIRLQTANESR